jgi:hypothetical protein
MLALTIATAPFFAVALKFGNSSQETQHVMIPDSDSVTPRREAAMGFLIRAAKLGINLALPFLFVSLLSQDWAKYFARTKAIIALRLKQKHWRFLVFNRSRQAFTERCAAP